MADSAGLWRNEEAANQGLCIENVGQAKIHAAFGRRLVGCVRRSKEPSVSPSLLRSESAVFQGLVPA
jgi:hypothetical protein